MDAVKLPNDMIGELLSHQRKMNDFQAELDKAEFCGIDCNQIRQAMSEASERINRLLTNYGPEAE